MPQNTFTLIEKITVGAAGASSITFTSIPQTYTDLKIVVSARDTTDNLPVTVSFNGSAIDSSKTLKGNGAGAFSASETVFWITPSSATASTFGSAELYIPNYTGSTAKSMSVDSVTENNSTTAYIFLAGQLENGTSAITSVTLTPTGTFAQYSTAYLYGIAKEGVSPSPSSAPYATGGDSIVFDGTYWIHTFTSSGTFTPKKALTCDYLVVAGGGGGGYDAGGGGGAGGLRSTVTATGGGGSLESALSLAANTGYTVTVGAGGSAGTVSTRGSSGSNSVFSTVTSTGGGGGGTRNTGTKNGLDGGSGGGGSGDGSTGGSASPSGQGFAGGSGNPSYTTGAGGGGAGAVGANPTGENNPCAGGNGVAVSISGSSVTYAGGGGGGKNDGAGGSGGGGKGGGSTASVAGTANTGGGGGGGNNTAPLLSGAAGGSGIVIVRYAA